MSSLLALAKDLEQQSKAQQQSTGEMLKAAFSEHEAYVNQELSESAKRINSAILDHDQKLASAIRQNTRGILKTIGRTWLIIAGVSFLLICTSGSILWWQGQQITGNYQTIRAQERTQAMLSEKNHGVQLSLCGEKKLSCVKVNPKAGAYGEEGNWMVLERK
ncbi:MbeB family mobilization protein [Salmonella enterica subsp. enterica serovar Derby]|nr:MbeB family mobilization protein [Salmonella enterica subsp. enterica serovar Derby]